VFVDADSPRQAKLKAVDLFQREGVNANVDDLEAIATTQDAGRQEQSWIVLDGFNRPVDTVQARSSDEALHVYGSVNNVDTRNYTAVPGAGNTSSNREAAVELPTSWALFVHNITNYSDEVLANTRQELLAGHMDDQLDMAQGADLLEKITAEQQRRSGSGDALNSLSEAWQTWLGQVGTHANETLENMLRTIEAGVGDVVRMTPEQRNLITTTIHQELRSRQTTNYNDLAANARRAENEVRASLPQSHREFLDDLANKSDMGLINILRNNNVYTGVSEQAAAYFRVQLKHELRRRGINPDSEAEANLVNNAAADQQNQLRRDDPVTSNDPEAESSIAPQSYRVGNHTYGREVLQATSQEDAVAKFAERNGLTREQVINEPGFVAEPTNQPSIPQTTATDFEVVKADGTVVTRITGGDMVYAHRQAREFERYLGLEGGELRVRALPTQTNESIKELRRLAGLK
jgi:hypothetical protein